MKYPSPIKSHCNTSHIRHIRPDSPSPEGRLRNSQCARRDQDQDQEDLSRKVGRAYPRAVGRMIRRRAAREDARPTWIERIAGFMERPQVNVDAHCNHERAGSGYLAPPELVNNKHHRRAVAVDVRRRLISLWYAHTRDLSMCEPATPSVFPSMALGGPGVAGKSASPRRRRLRKRMLHRLRHAGRAAKSNRAGKNFTFAAESAIIRFLCD